MESRLHKLSPILWTKNLTQTTEFDENVLGFTAHSNFANFVSLTRGEVEIMFVIPQDEPEDCKDPNDRAEFFPRPMLTGSLFIITENVNDLWKTIQGKVTVKSSIADREYGMRDFSILDNNGYELVFGQDIASIG